MNYCPRCQYPIATNTECSCELCGWFGSPKETLSEPGEDFNLTHAVIEILELYKQACRDELIIEQLYDLGEAIEKDINRARSYTRGMIHRLVEMFVKLKTRPNIVEVILKKYPSGFLPWPEEWTDYHYNSNQPCDMLIGPCRCGSWHQESDQWVQNKLIEHQAIITD